MSETDWGAFQRWWIDTYCQDGAYRKMDDVAWAAWQAGASASSSPAPAAEPVPADRAGLVEECKLRVRAVRDESWHSAHGAQGVNVGQKLGEAFAAIDRLASSAAQVPEGWQLVPKVPTLGMRVAGDKARQNVDDCTRTPAVYRAMLAAAPAAGGEHG